ncbi:MAG TPA: YceI family protein [Acidimicrobiales bacterium]|nr:YceI family protein [Acidimicrobiales bacterium]
MANTTEVTIPIRTGQWQIDPTHSSVEFSVRHMMVSKVKGRFTSFSGTITAAEEPLRSSVQASIDLASIDTHDETRDAHLRSADFFDVEQYPTMTFSSTALRQEGDHYLLSGDLTLHGVTRSLDLDLEANGVGPDPWGGVRAGFTATTQLNRKDFGLTWNAAIEGGGGVVVGDVIRVTLEIEAVQQ